MEVDKGSDQKSDIYPPLDGWRLKNKFTEDEKYHKLMTWLKSQHADIQEESRQSD